MSQPGFLKLFLARKPVAMHVCTYVCIYVSPLSHTLATIAGNSFKSEWVNEITEYHDIYLDTHMKYLDPAYPPRVHVHSYTAYSPKQRLDLSHLTNSIHSCMHSYIFSYTVAEGAIQIIRTHSYGKITFLTVRKEILTSKNLTNLHLPRFDEL